MTASLPDQPDPPDQLDQGDGAQARAANWRWRCESEEEGLGVVETLRAARIDAWLVNTPQGLAVESSDAGAASRLWHALAGRLAARSEMELRQRLQRQKKWALRVAYAGLVLLVLTLAGLWR